MKLKQKNKKQTRKKKTTQQKQTKKTKTKPNQKRNQNQAPKQQKGDNLNFVAFTGLVQFFRSQDPEQQSAKDTYLRNKTELPLRRTVQMFGYASAARPLSKAVRGSHISASQWP